MEIPIKLMQLQWMLLLAKTPEFMNLQNVVIIY